MSAITLTRARLREVATIRLNLEGVQTHKRKEEAMIAHARTHETETETETDIGTERCMFVLLWNVRISPVVGSGT